MYNVKYVIMQYPLTIYDLIEKLMRPDLNQQRATALHAVKNYIKRRP